MGYTIMWEKYKINLASMAAFVAWLWFFPLFGIMQTSFQVVDEKITVFNLVFFGSKILGFVIFLLLREKWQTLVALIIISAPLTAFSTWLVALMAWQFPDFVFSMWSYPFFIIFVFLPSVMGFAAAIYFAFWGTTIYYVSLENRGRYMAAMVFAATIFYIVLVIVFFTAPLLALFLSGLFLLIPSLFIKNTTAFVEESQEETNRGRNASTIIEGDNEGINPGKYFWLPFSLTVLCFYILSWVAHDIIFSEIKVEITSLPILGQAIYALAMLFAAFYLDREKEIEKIAVLGLIFLGCSFLLLPISLNFEIIWPLYFLLEGSYGLIDLFVWVSLAYFCQHLAGDPKEYYGRGLLLNIFFIMIGIIMIPLLNINFLGESYFLLSLVAGIILFIGLLPALSLRKIRLLDSHEEVSLPEISLSEIIEEEMEKLHLNQDFQMEEFTPREKEVLYLMLMGQKNPEIIEKLGISKNTLKTHVRNIYRKAEVKNRSELLFKFAEVKKD